MSRSGTIGLVKAWLMVALATGCGDGAVEPVPPPAPVPTTITISPASATLQSLGETVRLAATVQDQNGQTMSGATVAWASSDPSVATVDASGLVTAVANGNAMVTATAGSASGSAAVTVDQVLAAVVVEPATDTLLAFGDTLRLSAEAVDANGHAVASAEIAWASGDTLVAVVDQQGLVTGVSPGEAEVTASSAEVTGQAHLAVLAPAPTTLAISPDTVGFDALGQTARLVAEVRDQAGRAMEGVTVSWSSGDTTVALVDSTGLVTAAGTGTTTIAAKADSASGDAAVTVMQLAGSVVLSPSTDTISPGDTLRLGADAFDGNGHVIETTEFDWSSSDVSVVRVDAYGLATGVAEGRATVTAVAGDVHGTAEITVENPDRAALVALYNATDGPNWVNNENWLTDAPLGEWYGVDTDASGRVVGLNLGGRWDEVARQWIPHGLLGPIPPELGDLARLERLDLSNNGLWGGIPPVIGGLADLQGLYVRGNDLTGTIPASLGDLTSLKWLDARYNALTGGIPPELEGLSNLRILRLGFNDLTGAIPPKLGKLSSLQVLNLRYNRLTGVIPSELGNLTNLIELLLDTNTLTGPIPRILGNLSSLRWLLLYDNQLSGAIPRELEKLSHLAFLSLWGNDLSGTIPPWLADLSNLTYLDLGENQLSGPIPPELGKLSHLTYLSLSSNSLTGTLPPELGNLSKLNRLVIDDNDISGPVPRTFLNLPLQRFGWYCGDAKHDVCVPGTSEFVDWLEGIEWLGRFCNASDEATLSNLFDWTHGRKWTESGGWLGGPVLEEWHGVRTDSLGRVTALHLSDNGLEGGLASDLAELDQLTTLRIDGNPLAGRLPVAFTQLALSDFHYHGTELCTPTDKAFQSWLAGIESHEGTGVECAPLTDRDVLADLYRSNGGRDWKNNRNWLGDGPLRRWQGVEVNDKGRVVGLDLSENDISGAIPPGLGDLSDLGYLDLSHNELAGPIPPELGDLANLRILDLAFNGLTGGIPTALGNLSNLQRLHLGWNGLTGPIPVELANLADLEMVNLSDNDLTGAIPPELGDLSNLRWLYLASNDFSGTIPPALGDLSNLRLLDLAANDVTGAIPPALGDLSNLQVLDLASNDVTGAIPPELGDLSNLQRLYLGWNSLTGAIPPKLGDLSNLRLLDLAENNLAGAIPRKLGNLANLQRLQLTQNNLSGPVPPEFGGLARLEQLGLANNGELAGTLPASLVRLRLESFLTGGTDLCAPSDPAFQAWLGTIPKRWIASCGEAKAYLAQAVQSRTHPVPLVAGESALLRVFVTAGEATSEGIPAVRARFYLDGVERHVVEVPGKAVPIPTKVEEGELSKSANVEIPGRIIGRGLEMVVEIDPEGTLDPRLGVPKRIPETGRLAIEVGEMPALDLTAIPFLWRADPDSAVVEAAKGMAADPEGHGLLEDTRILLPVGELDVTAHDPVLSTSNDAFDLLGQTEALRLLEGGTGHYAGMMSGPLTGGVGGVAYVPGRSSFSTLHSPTIAHELGHNMGLGHAPCGVGGDPSFPDPAGNIGAWGYDFRNGLLVPPHRPDLMSYCARHWISGYHFANALAHRLSDEGGSAGAAVVAPSRSLLLWGGVDPDGHPFLNPAFVVEVPAALPDSAGDYTLTGRDSGGGEIFSLSFAMPEVANEAEAGSSFAFALPVRSAWGDALASVTLSGPDGDVELDGGTDRPMAILRDPRTGQVRAFLRDLPQATQAAMGAARRAAGPGMEVLFSRGIPEPSAWRP